MVVEVVQEAVVIVGEQKELEVYVDHLKTIVSTFGGASSSKGETFELLVRHCLERFNDYTVTKLPFLAGAALPDWCYTRRIEIERINTAKCLNYPGSGHKADLAFLKSRPSNELLVPLNFTRQDGIWFFDKEYAGTLAIKFHGEKMKKDTAASNESSGNIRGCFLKKSGAPAANLNDIRKEFEDSDTFKELKGTLRIHIEIPSVYGKKDRSLVVVDKKTSDVQATTHLSNLDDFFCEEIPEIRELVCFLKKLIHYVVSPT